MVRAEIEKKLAEFLTMLVPPGSGPEARRETMEAVAAVLGMYLAGDLAKLGRRRYVQSVMGLVAVVQGVAETSAVQLRGHAPRDKTPAPIVTPAGVAAPPPEMNDPDGEKGVLLSSMAALIHMQELEWWQLPGWPTALARATPVGLEIRIPAIPEEDFGGSSWLVARVQDQ